MSIAPLDWGSDIPFTQAYRFLRDGTLAARIGGLLDAHILSIAAAGHRDLVIVGYSAGGLGFYHWISVLRTDLAQRDIQVSAATIASPHRCPEGYIDLETSTGVFLRLTGLADPAINTSAVLRNLTGDLRVIYSESDRTALRQNVRFPFPRPVAAHIEHSRVGGASHTTICTSERTVLRVESLVRRSRR